MTRYLSVFIGLLLFLFDGCHLSTKNISEIKTSNTKLKKIAVAGMQAAIYKKSNNASFINPLSGSINIVEPIPEKVVDLMNDSLFDIIKSNKGFECVPPGQIKGVYASIVSTDEKVGMNQLDILREEAKYFNADAILAGYIYRWHERQGSEYAVDSPASVSFDLYLISADGSTIWHGKFDKTQTSFSENILDFKVFFERGAKWITVQELAFSGLDTLVAEMLSSIES